MTTPIGGPLTQALFLYNPILPSYDLVNLRVGLRKENWDVALYANNLFDETRCCPSTASAGRARGSST